MRIIHVGQRVQSQSVLGRGGTFTIAAGSGQTRPKHVSRYEQPLRVDPC
jgi:hypothetical protein